MLNSMSNVGKGSRKVSPIKSPIVLQGLTSIGFPNLNHKEVIVMDLMLRGLIVETLRKHEGKCLVGSDGFYGCGKIGQKMRDFSVLIAKGREGKQTPQKETNSNAQNQNRFYAL